MARKRVGEALTEVQDAQPAKLSKYAAKLAARRKETPEEKAQRLGIVTVTETEEVVETAPKEEPKTQTVAPRKKKKADAEHPNRKRPGGLYSKLLERARGEHMRRVREIEHLMRAERLSWGDAKSDLSKWYQGAEPTERMQAYTGKVEQAGKEEHGNGKDD